MMGVTIEDLEVGKSYRVRIVSWGEAQKIEESAMSGEIDGVELNEKMEPLFGNVIEYYVVEKNDVFVLGFTPKKGYTLTEITDVTDMLDILLRENPYPAWALSTRYIEEIIEEVTDGKE